MCRLTGHGVRSGSNGGLVQETHRRSVRGDQAMVMGIVTDIVQSDCPFYRVIV